MGQVTINTTNDLLFDSQKKESIFEEQEEYREQIDYLAKPERIMKILIEEFSCNLRKRRSIT